MARHEVDVWQCRDCDQDAIRSIKRPSGRRVHFCLDHLRHWATEQTEEGIAAADVRYVPARRGTCRECGCRDFTSCPGGCAWANRERTLCTACQHTAYAGLLESMVTQGLFQKVSP
jgi:hypothetical protein